MFIDGPFSMIVAIVLIGCATGVIISWIEASKSRGMDADMEEDFFMMRDEIDRLNERVRSLEAR